jgi:hypothetical protein
MGQFLDRKRGRDQVGTGMTSEKCLRIANAGGYWGDDPYALRRQVEGPLPIDYVSIDFLAEITMSILQKQRLRDPSAGYARDFVAQISPLLRTIKDKGIRVITNAGGVNPRACAEALFSAARAAGVELKVAIVEGDDVCDRLGTFSEDGLPLLNMDDGRAFSTVSDRVLSGNAYFGSMPVVAALRHDPDIVLCGRVTDTGITLAALIHEFGWAPDDYDRLAHGIVAGHIIECGAQATGGNFTDWRKVKSFTDMGFPIVECASDGSFVVTRHPDSGGLVSEQTVREQLLYEMGEPQSYITPDVIADFSTIRLSSDGPDRVRVSGVKGRRPTDLLKLSISYRDGFKTSGTLIICGPDARAKALCFADLFWEKLDSELRRQGLPFPAHRRTELIGHDATHGRLTPEREPNEVLLRLAARDQREDALKVFRKILPSLILSGPAGVAVTGGAPAISEIVSYWPALVPQELAPATIHLLVANGSGNAEIRHSEGPLHWPVTHGHAAAVEPDQQADSIQAEAQASMPTPGTVRVPLMQIAHARSGDKGDTANIGLIARSPQAYDFIQKHVTAQLVKNRFAGLCQGRVRRYPVPNLFALNFLLEQSLDGGGTMSLHTDAQGKTFSQALLRVELDVPSDLIRNIPSEQAACSGELVL